MINVILQFLELDLVNINASAKYYQNIPNGLRVNFAFFFRIWTSAKPRPIPNVIWLSHELHHVNINVFAKFHHNIPLSSRDRAIFTFFRIWSSAKPRLTKNVISQSLGLDLVDINVYTKVYQNIPFSSRDRAIFTFSEFEPRPRLGQSQMIFDNLFAYILSISMRMQNFIKILQTV